MAEKNWAAIPYTDLTEPQKDFLRKILQDSDRNYFLKGCAGSGKTVIAAHAVQLLRQEGNKSVKLLVYTKLLSKFINDGFKGIDSQIENVEHFHSWQPSFNDKIDIIIVDESQDFKSEWISKVKAFSSNQIWLGDASQQIYADSKNDNGFKEINNEFISSDVTELNTNYRNSISIAELAKNFISLNEFDQKDDITVQEKINNFILPIANNERQTSGARNQPNVFIEAQSESVEFDSIVKIVKSIQNSDSPSKQIGIAQLKHEHLDLIESELRKRGLNFIRIPKEKEIHELPDFENKNLTILSPIHSLKGLEFDFIIFPRSEIHKIGFWEDKEINDNLMFVLFSRAKTRIYVSYVNRNQSYIYSKIKNNLNEDFFQFVSSDEILGNGIPEKSKEDVEKKLKQYFDEMEI